MSKLILTGILVLLLGSVTPVMGQADGSQSHRNESVHRSGASAPLCDSPSCWNRIVGYPEIRNFNTAAMDGAATQNWHITQDSTGLLYVGNQSRLLEFDGVNWRSYPLGGLTVFSVSTSGNRLFYGSSERFGVAEPDEAGGLSSRRLDLHTRDDIPVPNAVWATATDGPFVYFRDQRHLFQWRDSVLTTWPVAGLSRFYSIRDTLFLYDTARGLLYIDNGTLQEYPSGSLYARIAIYAMFPSDDGLYTITRARGVEEFTATGRTSIESPINEWLRTTQVYTGIALRQGGYALGSLQNGIVITDEHFVPILHLTTDNGLVDNGILSLYQDHENGIWAGTNNGISRITWPARFTQFDERSEINQTIHTLLSARGRLYAGGTNGVWVSPEVDPSQPYTHTPFRKLDEITGFVYYFIELPSGVLAGTADGIWLITPTQTVYISESMGRAAWYDSPAKTVYFSTPYRMYAATIDGTVISTPQILFNFVPGFVQFVLRDNQFWGVSTDTLVRRINLPDRRDASITYNGVPEPTIKTWALPTEYSSVNIHLHQIGNDLYFANNAELFRHDIASDSMVVAPFFTGEMQNGETEFFKIIPAEDSSALFIRARRRNWVSQAGPDGLQQATYRPLNHMIHPRVQDIAVQGPLVWYAGNRGLTLWNTTVSRQGSVPFSALIRQVSARSDSIIFRGHYAHGHTPPTLTHAEHNMRFSYAALTFDKPDSVRYFTWLDPYEPDWSRATTETRKDYTGLPEGSYTFRVKAINIDGIESSEAAYRFRILPPWYRTWWSYAMYLLSGGGLLFAIYTWRVNYLISIERARHALARDLHDEVSATLSSITFFAESAKLLAPTQQANPMLEKISFNAKDAQDKIQDIIWSASPEHDTWEGFLPKIQRFASDLCESRDIDYAIAMPRKAPEGDMDMYFRKDFWLMFKEILTNAVRHSGCSRIEVDIACAGSRISLRIADNGKGFDAEQRTSRNGVKNIFARAKTRKAQIDLDTAPGRGTVWQLSMKHS